MNNNQKQENNEELEQNNSKEKNAAIAETNQNQQEDSKQNQEEVKEQFHETSDLAAKLEERIKELENNMLRSVAENENMRKRYVKMIEEAKEYAIFSFAKNILNISDALTNTLTHIQQISEENINNFVSGIEMTKTELDKIFKENDISIIAPVKGEKFNYDVHHAISEIESNEVEKGSIIQVIQTGYKLKDRLLRPSLVVLAK